MGYPVVEKKQTQAFARAWDKGGIKIILDDTAIQFATDYANVVLKSFVEDIVKARAAKAQAAPVPTQANSAVPTQANAASAKSSIILTDS
jgi:hypothetical protein